MNDIVQTGGPDVPAWDPNSGDQLPAYLSNALEDLGTNIPDRMTVPSLSYEGKTWTIIKDNNKTKLQAQNADGDMVPVPIMRAVILNFNADRGRAYYPGTYNPAAAAAPTCWSADGKAPDPSVKEKQSRSCADCPMSVKGSKVQDGKEMVACSSHRMIAIAPAFDIDGDPLRLKIAVTSDYDKEIVEHGWFAFRQYSDYLKSRGITHTALVVTKIKFDSSVAYPKLLFALDRVLGQDEVLRVKQALGNPKVNELLAEKWTAAGSNGTDKGESDLQPYGLEGAYADGWQAHPDSAGWSWKGQEVVKNEDLAARYPEPKAPALPTEAAPAIPASEQVIEGKVTEPATTTAPVESPVGGLPAAQADGWTPHPEADGYHYKGQEVVANDDLAARYAGKAEPVPATAPAAPASEPPAAASSPHDPTAAAEADGWVKHPEADGYHYKGQDVVATADLAGKYPEPAAGDAVQSSPPSPPADSPAPAPDAGGGATGEIPAEVQGLLDKWSG